MQRHPSFALAFVLAATFAVRAASAGAAQSRDPAGATLSARDSALHLLERFAYGPTPGAVERVARQGALAWFDAQLAREPRADSALAARERALPALTLGTDDWARMFLDARRRMRARRAAADAPPPDSDADDMAPRARMAERPEVGRLLDQVRAVAVLRAVTAEDQVREVMTDFWVNHFNVFQNKGADRFLVPGFVEHVIRPRVLGRFEDLLVATAHSPAMLFYLDNVQSVAAGVGRGPARRGINENYARELLELHTLGVDGGYTQADVIGVARILTGWSMQPAPLGGGFVFRPRVHDYDAKVALGTRFPAGHGEDEGEHLLQLLARHPATIRHVCTQLCTRFVADDPPADCVDAAVAAWQRSDGDMRAVLRAIVRTPGFWSARALRSKVKTPLEFVVSALRAVGALPDSTARLANIVARLGEPLYLEASPAGYPERKDAWVTSGALLGRMNFAIALAAGRLPGATLALEPVVPETPDAAALVDAIDRQVLSGVMTDSTRRVILAEIADMHDPARSRALATGLALGSPEFQRQ